MKKFLLAGVALALGALVNTTATATTIRPMGEISPAGTTINNPTSWGRGYEFTANALNIKVTELGYVTPNSGEYTLALWDVTNSVLLANVEGLTGTTSAITWEFFSISPVMLTQGNNYFAVLYGANSSSYYFTADSAYHPSGDIEYVQMRFCNGCTVGSGLPGQLIDGYNYGFADIGYESASQAPLPNGVALLLTGLAGIVIARRTGGKLNLA